MSVGLLFACSGIVTAGCDKSLITANPAEPHSECVKQCGNDFNDHTSMDCTRSNVERILCPEYCAQARDDSCESKQGNPINLSDGSKYQEETDYVGSGSHPLEIRRYFQSSFGNIDGTFGFGWSGINSSRIEARYVKSEGAGTYADDMFLVKEQDGSVVTFLAAGSANGAIMTVPAKANVTDRLSVIEDAGGWALHYVRGDGVIEHYRFDMDEYDSNNKYSSKLEWRQFLSGEKHYFSYSDDEKVTAISDDYGSKLAFTYHPSSTHVASITVTPGNRVYHYDYDANGNLTHAYFPDDTPTNTTDDPFKRYHYEDARFTHYLTGITDEQGGRYATFAYNEDGNAISTEHAGGVEKVEVVSYAEPNGGVRVRNALGKDTIYRYTKTGSGASTSKRLIAVDGQASANCAASNSTYSYDANGFRDKITDGRGFVTDFDHNTKGQEIRRTEALGQQEQRTTETDWYPSGTLKEIRTPGKTTRFTYTQGDGLGRLVSRTETDTTTHSAPYATQGVSRTWSYSYTYHDAGHAKLRR
ncbi:hypothetical protein HDN1F_35570 [gamma proteobacterium HdN1]|nr:hypothetical protein HDN1F_35570 [gamma proteobacterium HdN1]